MSQRRVLEPGPQHPITITPVEGVVRVMKGGVVLAQSSAALRLDEASYPPVFYIPRADMAATTEPSDTKTWCPFKGEASYVDLVTDNGARVADIAWVYPTPHGTVTAIADHFAFYGSKVDAIEQL